MGELWQGRWRHPLMVAVLLMVVSQGCSIRSVAIKSLTDALASGGDVIAADEDPELIRDALPFTLKTIEILLASDPENFDLLVMACRGFSGYSYGFVELDATRVEPRSYRQAEELRSRALKLYLRARSYCVRAFDLRFAGRGKDLPTEFEAILSQAEERDSELLYWLGGSWGKAISLGLDRPELVADLPVVRALIERALEVDPSFDRGALHEAMISIEAVPEAMGGSLDKARSHFDAAVRANGGSRVSTYVSWASALASSNSGRAEFESALDAALAIDVDAYPQDRLANILGQERAEMLKSRAGDYYLEELGEDDR